jgi:hypothetical protein
LGLIIEICDGVKKKNVDAILSTKARRLGLSASGPMLTPHMEIRRNKKIYR